MLLQILLGNSTNASVIILIYKYRSFFEWFQTGAQFLNDELQEKVLEDLMPNTQILFNHKWLFSKISKYL